LPASSNVTDPVRAHTQGLLKPPEIPTTVLLDRGLPV
jgi:hypothetical protein